MARSVDPSHNRRGCSVIFQGRKRGPRHNKELAKTTQVNSARAQAVWSQPLCHPRCRGTVPGFLLRNVLTPATSTQSPSRSAPPFPSSVRLHPLSRSAGQHSTWKPVSRLLHEWTLLLRPPSRRDRVCAELSPSLSVCLSVCHTHTHAHLPSPLVPFGLGLCSWEMIRVGSTARTWGGTAICSGD